MEKNRKDKNQNIQVFVRLRPLNQREHDIRSLGVVEVCSNREVLVRQSQSPSITKKFTFDRAFGPGSKQVDVYQSVVSPLIEEVLAGYNCTVFAYGQTGTGKTHTMVGESSDHKGSRQNDPMAGIIPRSLGQLFDELRLSNSEFTVRVSYLELYNEDFFDLLAPVGSGDTKLKMYEASKGSSEVKGLEEALVRSKEEVYQILAQGQERRRIASTLMNAQSSRSHTVFTIVVRMNMKEPTADGEELVKTGKLNLVDLAGSENISKAGSDNPGKGDRKRECVVINQSLLTLGRVITALVERHPHIPYRESKLTRLLQESLGGRTKTSIIATISPGHKDLEETLSTLEYAHRARNIQNKPEINQRVLKTQMMGEMVEDLDRLKRDLYATREQKGIYYSVESHAEVQLQLANQKKEIQDQILQIKAMKEDAERLEAGLKAKVDELHVAEETLGRMEQACRRTERRLDVASRELSSVSAECEEQRHLVGRLGETEERLTREARAVCAAADVASEHAASLHRTVAKRRKLEQDNLETTKSYGSAASERRAHIQQHLETATDDLSRDLARVSQELEKQLSECTQHQEESKNKMDSLVEQMKATITEVASSVAATQEELSQQSSVQQEALRGRLQRHSDAAAARLQGAIARLSSCLEEARRRDGAAVDDIRTTVGQLRAAASERLQALAARHEACYEAWSELERAAVTRAQAEAARRREHARLTLQALATEQQEMQDAKERLQQEIDRVMNKNRVFCATLAARASADDAATASEQRELEAELAAARGALDGGRSELAAALGGACADVDTFAGAVLAGVEAAHEAARADVDRTREALEGEISAVVQEERQNSETLAQETSGLLCEALESSKRALASTLTSVQSCEDGASCGVRSLRAELGERWSAEAAAAAARAADVRAAGGALATLRDELRHELLEMGALEETFLQRDYQTYSPTGSTPARTEYRYPREFSATSPHERIIARFRAQRSRSTDDDCVEVSAGPVPDEPAACEEEDVSSLSSDSACVFLAPSPPVETPVGKLPPLCKSTSESDMFRRKNGKENGTLSNASSLQKLSKLRQPSSHKKVLTQKN